MAIGVYVDFNSPRDSIETIARGCWTSYWLHVTGNDASERAINCMIGLIEYKRAIQRHFTDKDSGFKICKTESWETKPHDGNFCTM